jgi:hypothetical protein
MLFSRIDGKDAQQVTFIGQILSIGKDIRVRACNMCHPGVKKIAVFLAL